jgi:hypothetical protein
MAIVRLPTGAARYDIEWCVDEGAAVEAGQPLGWLCGPGRCGLEALRAPLRGVVGARWTSLLEAAPGGAAVALVGDGDAAVVREEEAHAVAARVREVEAELARLEAHRPRNGASAALLDAELTRLSRWLAAAREALASRQRHRRA